MGTGNMDEVTQTLLSCALVCRAWLHRARLHLYAKIRLSGTRISRFQSTLKKNRHFPLTFIKTMAISCRHYPISVLLATKLQNLTYLELTEMDLALEHPLSTRSVLNRSVRSLVLQGLKGCTVSGVLRFINSFHCVDSLQLHFSLRNWVTGDKYFHHRTQSSTVP